ncbi:MAG: NAD-dependent succinate-semialdehyde dehydrogenase [Alphaproteobacteria bacterium]|jgi:succinate-semialdehyde dehydrogenase/glutarate-semialdehyde dehydrogenase|nr:NAD-dependent succinate-semialdehyde dehydrogenase [Alphaproteobacteria bacterium]
MKLKNTSLLKDKAFVAGEWVKGAKSFDVTNPANGSVVGSVPDLTPVDVKKAIEAAHKAQPAWAAKSAKERAKVLRAWSDLMIQNADDLAAIMTAEQGKPLAEAKTEILSAASFYEWFGEEAKRVYGDTIPSTFSNSRISVIKQPVGVCAAITPWNFPTSMIARKAAPALAVGCAMIIKPAGETPLSALAQVALAEEAGVPKGILSVITSRDSKGVGLEMCESELVRKLSFTGSTEVGRILMKQCSGTIKRISLELGGNAPFIVFDDADLDAAVDGVIASKYRNAGQTCVCANRIYVQDKIYDVFAEKLATKVKALKVGDGSEQGVQIGPLINEDAVVKVKDHIKNATENGAKIVTGGQSHKLGGLFFEPTVLTGVTQKMKVAKEETFGPVAPLFKFKDEQEVIEMANDTIFGLAAYFYARDIGRITRVSEALEYGMVGVNAGIVSTEVAPFGGVKQSGIGREGSKYGLDEYLEIKYVLTAGLNS